MKLVVNSSHRVVFWLHWYDKYSYNANHLHWDDSTLYHFLNEFFLDGDDRE